MRYNIYFIQNIQESTKSSTRRFSKSRTRSTPYTRVLLIINLKSSRRAVGTSKGAGGGRRHTGEHRVASSLLFYHTHTAFCCCVCALQNTALFYTHTAEREFSQKIFEIPLLLCVLSAVYIKYIYSTVAIYMYCDCIYIVWIYSIYTAESTVTIILRYILLTVCYSLLFFFLFFIFFNFKKIF